MLDKDGSRADHRAPIQSELQAVMLGQERWEEIRRMFFEEKLAIAEIARRLAIDRKTVRSWLRKEWQPYQRAPKDEASLTGDADSLRERAAQGKRIANTAFPAARKPDRRLLSAVP